MTDCTSSLIDSKLSSTGPYWFQLIPELCLKTKDDYTKWLDIATTSLHAMWSSHCQREVTIEQFATYASALDVWIKKYDNKFRSFK